MAKATIKLMKKIIQEKLSKKEIDHVTTYMQYQENDGTVQGGVNRKEVKCEGHMAESTHYNCIKSLSEKGFYVIDENTKDTVLIENSFVNSSGELDFHENNYVELPNFIHDYEFQSAPVQVKRLVIYFLLCGTKSQYKTFNAKTLQNILGLNRPEKLYVVLRQLGGYDWFYVIENCLENELTGDLYYQFQVKLQIQYAGTSRLDHNKKAKNQVRNILNKKRIIYTPKALADLAQLLNQYKDKFFDCIKHLNQATAQGRIFRSIICRNIALN
ncbi:hypothetical protein [Acetivibrio cellulolyticus]|uniref:hypothetical protein n=1 Tax=Acetivibrio cellulolyticus TaxID=35830 RepID=UPI0001E2CC7C|nr:hypothetical protein [Acetivibrio cellulolyticus]